MNPPQFLTTLYAIGAAIRNGDIDEGEVVFEVLDMDRTLTMTATIRRYAQEEASEEVGSE